MMRLTILGAGTPAPKKNRFGSSYLVQVAGDNLLFDCGPSTSQKLARADMPTTKVDRLFFTHHHFDHNADYPAFALSRWDQGADLIADLKVYGPWPTAEVTERLFGPNGAFAFDIQARMNHPPSHIAHVERGGTLPRRPPTFDLSVLTPGDIVTGSSWEVRTTRVEHAQPYLDSIAYRIESADGALVLSGDTRPCDALVDLAEGADTLVMMCWDEQAKVVRSGLDAWLSGTESAGLMGQRAHVRRLVLSHIRDSLATLRPADAIAQANRTFDGEVIVAQEQMQLVIGVENGTLGSGA
jgi:ribonuclease Z